LWGLWDMAYAVLFAGVMQHDNEDAPEFRPKWYPDATRFKSVLYHTTTPPPPPALRSTCCL